jgi:hypothetical protein
VKLHLLTLFSAASLVLFGAPAYSRETSSDPSGVGLIANFSSDRHLSNVGTTIFQNKERQTETDFDATAEALAIAKSAFTRSVVTASGNDLHLPAPDADPHVSAPTLIERLIAAGHEWHVNTIFLLTSGTTNDWIFNTTEKLDGVGLYRREVFGMKRQLVYGVFELRTFDCRTGKFTKTRREKEAREVPGVQWHETWADYPASEKRNVVRGWRQLFKETIPPLLTKADLANAPESRHESTWRSLLFARDRPKSWLPEGNELEIPEGITRDRAHLAILNGLKDRQWTVTADAPDRVVGIYRAGKKEAGVIAVITAATITLTPADHEVQSDGQRTPASYERWQRNLKESIYSDLLKADPEAATK